MPRHIEHAGLPQNRTIVEQDLNRKVSIHDDGQRRVRDLVNCCTSSATTFLRIVTLARIEARRIVKALHQPHAVGCEFHSKSGVGPGEDPRELTACRHNAGQRNCAAKERAGSSSGKYARAIPIRARPARANRPIGGEREILSGRLRDCRRRCEFDRLLCAQHTPTRGPAAGQTCHERHPTYSICNHSFILYAARTGLRGTCRSLLREAPARRHQLICR